MIVPERVFVHVSLKVFRADPVVHTRDARLDQAPEPLNRVRVLVPIYVDLCAMIDGLVIVPEAREADIDPVLEPSRYWF
jgi:hypothetical protein